MLNKNTLPTLSLIAFSLLYIAFVSDQSWNSRSPAQLASHSHSLSTKDANQRLLTWLDKKSSSLKEWMGKRGTPQGPPDFLDFYFPSKTLSLSGPYGQEINTARETKNLYDEYFPPQDPSSYVGTFFESGHPYIQTSRGPYQWDSSAASGMDDLKLFKKAVKALSEAGIKSMRLGPNLFEVKVYEAARWKNFIDKIEVMWMEGVTPTISVAFFPSLQQWEVKNPNGTVDYENSYLLNSEWPKDMGRLTKDLMMGLWKRAEAVEAKLGHKVNIVINPINEPETLAGFNRQFWHGAHANWAHPETMKYYIPSILHIAMANVEIRLAVEESSPDRRVLFMHNEAMTPVYYPSHQGGGRFAVSKFMLGDDVILNEDFNHLQTQKLSDLEQSLKKGNETHWAMERFIFAPWNKNDGDRDLARKFIVAKFQSLKDLHLKLQNQTSKSMKTDNILLLDYYCQTEFIPNSSIEDFTSRLALNHGEELKKVLDVKTEQGFLQMLRAAATSNEADLPPEGPKGPQVLFNYQDTQDINFEALLTENDFVVLERLIGLRREYTFLDGRPFEVRQRRAGLRPLKSPLYRTDHLIDGLLKDGGTKLMQVLGVKNHSELMSLMKVGRKIDESKPLVDLLNGNGREILHQLLGIERKFLLGFEPQHYARQVRAGIRYGFYQFMIEYVDALRVYAAGVGESGTPFYIFAPLLHDQLMMEYAATLKSGIYGTQYSFGPAVDTRGWAKAPLGLHYQDDHEINPSGLLKIVPANENEESHFKFRGDEATNQQWPIQFLKPLLEDLKQ